MARKNREMLFVRSYLYQRVPFVHGGTRGLTLVASQGIAVSAAIVPGATFTHFNATYVILRAAAPIRLRDTVHRWITLGGPGFSLDDSPCEPTESLSSRFPQPGKDHFGTIEFAELDRVPGHHGRCAVDKLDAGDSCFLLRLVDVNVSAVVTNYCGIRCR